MGMDERTEDTTEALELATITEMVEELESRPNQQHVILFKNHDKRWTVATHVKKADHQDVATMLAELLRDLKEWGKSDV